MDDCFNSYCMQSVELDNDVQREDRCRVIKLLQEQVSSLLFYKNEYDQMKKRAEMAERLLEMRESEIKLKFDELEETFKILEDENQRLKTQLANGFKNSKQSAANNESSSQDIEQGENKWKLKYKALARMANGTIESNVGESNMDNSALQSQIDDLKRLNDEKSKSITILSEELQKASKESTQAKESASRFLKQVQKLQNEIDTYKDENSKLKANQRQKSALLAHTRNQQEKNIKNQKQIEQSTNMEIEEQKKKFVALNAEVTRLTNAYDKELKVRKSAEKKIIKLTKSNEAIKEKLQETLKKFQNENKLLQDEINGNKVTQENLQNDLKQAHTANEELQSELNKAEKIKKKKEKLELIVKEMQETIDELQTSISSVESDFSARFEELKNLLIKYWGGAALNYDWNDCLSCIDEKFSIYQANEAMILMLKAKMSKMKKRNQKLHNDIIQNSESQSVSTSQPSEAFSSDGRAEPQIIYKEVPNPYKDINLFRHAVTRRMNKIYFKLYDDVEKLNNAFQSSANEQINNNNSYDESDTGSNCTNTNKEISMRSLILFSIITQRWKTFKNDQEFDKTSILEYLPSKWRKETNQIPLIIQKMRQSSMKLRQQIAQNSILAKANQELTIRTKQAESELLKIQQINQTRFQETNEIQQKIKFYESKCQKLIDPQVHESVKQQLQKQIIESKNLEKQLVLLKSEMKNLLASIDGKHEEISDMQANMMNLADENEELKHHLDDLSHELSVTQAALKERTKELLAIERKLMKEKKSVVIVKESIPLSQSNYKNQIKEDHQSNCSFLTEAIRGGLAKMQTKIMKGDGMI
ncbi:hypothetical protein M9Y10_016374 [Tritrichomonas musculus]|uniref:Uncharacterized protein n=1 Tax=Tritrichomonas musculus TaxID=1915356 RepID=A0ABR2HXU0_9EUKA